MLAKAGLPHLISPRPFAAGRRVFPDVFLHSCASYTGTGI